MLSGFNTNFRYRGVLFHVQTEDSGRDNPHIITHLFHGGNILASVKSEYRDLLDHEVETIEDAVRKRMEEQHKSMLKQLSRGGHDAVIEERLGADALSASDPSSTTTETDSLPPAQIIDAENEPVVGYADLGGSETLAAIESSPPDPVEPTPSEEAPANARFSRVFGDRVVSEKPLDEVVLDYLVENARKRKRKPQ